MAKDEEPTVPATQTEDVTVLSDGLPPPPADAPEVPDYQITGRLGEGGMGVVWKAVQLSTRREVALKLLAPSAFGSARAMQRFEREVELAARLEHPNIARVYESGLTRGVHYYAMQLVDGLPLDRYVEAFKLDKRRVLSLMRKVCDAVQFAHQRGIIHRDLKPSNIVVTDAGEPYLLDFGLAKGMLEADHGSDISVDGQVAGTPAYMSPEQAAGRITELDTRTDIYSLGVILYKLLIGAMPHDLTGSYVEIIKRIGEQEVRRPRDASRSGDRTTTTVIDRELETLLLKALAREREQRYSSADEMSRGLGTYLSGDPLIAKRPTVTYVLRKRLVKHRVGAAIAGGLVLLAAAAVGAGAYWLYHRPVELRVSSNPAGAQLKINGQLKLGCGVTPCRAELGPGTHTIELVLPNHYQAQPRTVHVKWGRITGDAYEPIVLAPERRTVLFTTDPSPAQVQVRREDSGEVLESFTSPKIVELPRGRYVLHYGGGEDVAQEPSTPGYTLGVRGDTAPLTVHFNLFTQKLSYH